MEYVFLIIGFDCRTGFIFYPEPALFRTEDEAIVYCKNHTNEAISYSHRRINFGKYTKKKMKGKNNGRNK